MYRNHQLSYLVKTTGLIVILLLIITMPVNAQNSAVERVRALINQQYVDSVPTQVNQATTIDGMIKALGDPYTQYFTQAEFKQFQAALDQTFVGIGIIYDTVPQGVLVKSIIAASPAEKSGLKLGDIIQTVNGTNLVGLDSTSAGKLIRGPEGTQIKVQILRQENITDAIITRKAINLPSISYNLLTNHIGYININAFSSDTGQKFGEAAAALQNQGAVSWIIDLRDNGGGYLEAARVVAGFFIGDQTCLQTQNRSGISTPLAAQKADFELKGRTIILVNDETASASEVLAGALQDYHRALVIGKQTFGKGCVQWLFNLDNDGVLKLTCEKYRTPYGREVNKVGITPDLTTTVDNVKLAELLLSGQALLPRQPKTSVVVKGTIYPISMTQANNLAYKHIYRELIKLTTAKGKLAQ